MVIWTNRVCGMEMHWQHIHAFYYWSFAFSEEPLSWNSLDLLSWCLPPECSGSLRSWLSRTCGSSSKRFGWLPLATAVPRERWFGGTTQLFVCLEPIRWQRLLLVQLLSNHMSRRMEPEDIREIQNDWRKQSNWIANIFNDRLVYSCCGMLWWEGFEGHSN